MKLTFTFLLVVALFTQSIDAQKEWRLRNCFPSSARRSNASFSVGNKGYIVCGYQDLYGADIAEVWEYDPLTDSWTQKNNYPHINDGMSVFVINDTAYVGLGYNEVGTFYRDFYRYDAAGDTWVPIANFPGVVRYLAMAFSLNGKGYVGCGKGAGQNNDFYEYDPGTNTWAQKANFPGAARQTGVGIANSTTGMIGCGYDGNFYSDLYTYNPTNNTWSQITSFPTVRAALVSFVLNDTIYCAAGSDGNVDYSDCWRYDIPNNTWVSEPGFSCISGSRTIWSIGFSFYGHAFIYGGVDNVTYNDYNDVLEFGPHDTAFIKQVHVLGADTGYCGNFNRILSTGNPCTIWSTGATASQITVTNPGTYWAYWADTCGMVSDTIHISTGISSTAKSDTGICNLQTLTLSTSAGGSAYHWNTGAQTQSISVSTAGIYSVTITPAGGTCLTVDSIIVANYLLRDSLNITAASCGINNGAININITQGYAPYQYLWSNGATSSAISSVAPGNYSVSITDSKGCTVASNATITTTSVPSVTTNASKTVLCPGDSTQICATFGFTSYRWNNGDTSACTTVTLSGNYYVTVSSGTNCSASSSGEDIVVLQPSPVVVSVSSDTLLAYNDVSYQWYLNGNLIPGDTFPMLIAPQTGTYDVRVLDSRGCYATSNQIPVTISGMADINFNKLVSVYPNPSNNGVWNILVEYPLIGGKAEVYDINGRLLYNNKIKDLITSLQLPVETGVYLLKIQSGENLIIERLVK